MRKSHVLMSISALVAFVIGLAGAAELTSRAWAVAPAIGDRSGYEASRPRPDGEGRQGPRRQMQSLQGLSQEPRRSRQRHGQLLRHVVKQERLQSETKLRQERGDR